MWLCDVLNWKMMCCELRRAHSSVRCNLGMQDTRKLRRAHVTELPLGTTRIVSLRYYSVLQSTTAVHTSYYKVLRVLHSMTPYYKILRRTTTYTMPYHNVLRRSTVSTTPVLFCTTKYYAVPKYYAIVQGTTPVLFCTTK